MKPALTIAVIAALASSASAGLVSHTRVSYGDANLVTVEHFGAAQSISTSSYSTPGSFSGTAEAWATYGLVRGRSGAVAQNTSFETQLVQAEASFSDTITITGGTGAGFVIYEYTVTGSTIGGEHDAHAHLFLRHGGDPDEELGHLTGNTVLNSLPHNFTFSTPFTTGALLSAEIHMHHGHTGTAIADFSPGAMLTGIRVFDSQMVPIVGFSVTSESGTVYPLPAPSGAVLLAGGLSLLSRRKRS